MSRTSTDRITLNGATMGSRWQATLQAPPDFETAPLHAALQQAVDEVVAQMSTWVTDSDLMRLNAAPVGAWIALQSGLRDVLALALKIGRASGGAFDIGMGDAVTAWGFGPHPASEGAIRAAMAAPRRPAHEIVEIDGNTVRKTAPIVLDLNGIAKGYGVDRLADTVRAHGIADALVGIDGEMRALGLRGDGTPWTIAVEAPDPDRRAPHAILGLQDAAVATSGDYRHWVEVQGRRLSHTMDPARGAPLAKAPGSVTVVAASCAAADAWATALMVAGEQGATALARRNDLDVLLLFPDDRGDTTSVGIGRLFERTCTDPRIPSQTRRYRT